MSRFFHASDSSSDSSSEEEDLYKDEERPKDSEEESEEDSEEEASDEESSDDEAAQGVNRFLRSDDEDESSDEEDDKVTVVKSAKDKKFEELEGTVRLIENYEKNNDWAKISAGIYGTIRHISELTIPEYDHLNRQLPRLIRDNDGKIPKLYIKAVADLETLTNETVEKQKVTLKKMNALAVKGLNAVRQKIRKTNKEYQNDINAYREDKEAYMKEDEPEEEAVPIPRKRPREVFGDGEVAPSADEGGWEGVGRDGRALKYTADSILKHLRTIVETRGRKNTDRLEQIRIMERLLEVAISDYQRIRVLLTLVSTRFDMTSGSGNYMLQEQWRLYVYFTGDEFVLTRRLGRIRN